MEARIRERNMKERVTLGQRRPSPWWEAWRWWRSSRSKRARRRDPGFWNEPGTRSSQRQQKLRDIKKESPGRRCPRPSLEQVAGTWTSSTSADRSNLRSSSSSLRTSLWRKRGTTSCWALNICFCKNLRVLCDVDDHGDDKMNDHRLAHLAYILLTVCCPWRDEMWLFRICLLILWFPFILSSGFSTFLEYISHVTFWFYQETKYDIDCFQSAFLLRISSISVFRILYISPIHISCVSL